MRQTNPVHLLLKWIVAHTLAISITSTATFSMVSFNNFEQLTALLVLSGVISGLCLGGVEAWLLRPWLPKQAGWWVVVTIVAVPLGMVGGGFLGFLMIGFFSTSIDITMQQIMSSGAFGFGIGAIVGVAQWAFLRKGFRHAWLWIAAVTAGRSIGWSAGFGAIFKLDLPNLTSPALPAGIGGALGGTLYGIITGLCLTLLVAQYKRENTVSKQQTEG